MLKSLCVAAAALALCTQGAVAHPHKYSLQESQVEKFTKGCKDHNNKDFLEQFLMPDVKLQLTTFPDNVDASGYDQVIMLLGGFAMNPNFKACKVVDLFGSGNKVFAKSQQLTTAVTDKKLPASIDYHTLYEFEDGMIVKITMMADWGAIADTESLLKGTGLKDDPDKKAEAKSKEL